MSVYKRGGMYHYRFMFKGQRYRGSTGEQKYSPAKTYESTLITELRDRGSLIRKSLRLSEFSTQFLHIIKASSLEEKTKAYYQNGWRLLSETRLADVMVDQITRQDAQSLTFTGSASNANNALRTLSRMLGIAEEKHLLYRKPKIRLLKEQRRQSMLTEEWEKRLVPVAEQPLADVIILMRDSGVRNIRELFPMRIESIYWAADKIGIPDSKTAAGVRVVPISDRSRKILIKRAAGRTTGWLFPSKRSESGHIVTVQKQWEKALDALRKQDIHVPDDLVLYCARHDFGTTTYKATKNIFAVMSAMGHTSTQTAALYQHQDIDEVLLAVKHRGSDTKTDTTQS